MRILLALLVLALGCGGGGATETHEAAANRSEATSDRVRATPSTQTTQTSEPRAEPAAQAPRDDDAAPSLDLLHAVPATVVVSSAYRDEARQAPRLVDGDLESAWNSRTGDLVGAWVEFQLPVEATVREVLLTVGFPRQQGALDLFTANQRIAEVRVSRGETTIGTFPLDVTSRELQRIAVSGDGGIYRITVTRVTAGSRSDWREAIISELRVMGTAAGAAEGAHTPSVRVADARAAAEVERGPESERAAPALAAPEPAPAPVADAGYFGIRSRGLAQLSEAGMEVLHAGPIADFAIDGAGVHVLAGDGRHLFVIANGQRRELAIPETESFSIVALGPDGAAVLASAFGIWWRRGTAWSSAEAMDTSVPDWQAQQPQRLVVGPDGTTWVLGQHSLFRGRRGRYSPEYLPTRVDSNVVGVAVGATGVVAAVNNRELFIRSAGWRRIERPLGDMALREVAVGPDGTVVAGAYDGVVVVPADAEPLPVRLADAGIITAVARDERGRTFIGSTGGLFVLGPDHTILGRWPGVPGFEGTIDEIALSGRGPELPAR